MPRHVVRLVTRLVVDYFASRGLVIDYFAYAVRPGASARRAVRHPDRRRLLRLSCTSGCLGTSHGSSSTTSPTPHVRVPRHVPRLVTRLVVPLLVDFFAYTERPGVSAHRAARRRLLRLRRAPGCLGTSGGSSRGSSSTTSPTPRVRVPRHVARLITRLVVNYSVRRNFVLRTHWLYFSHAVRRNYLSRNNTGSTSSTLRTTATSFSDRIASTTHLD
jgi:hypothetical protein